MNYNTPTKIRTQIGIKKLPNGGYNNLVVALSYSMIQNNFYLGINDKFLNSFDDDSLELIRAENQSRQCGNKASKDHSYSIRICIYSESLNPKNPNLNFDPQKVIYDRTTSLSINSNNQIVISWGKALAALKSLFPFTEAVSILSQGQIKMSSAYQEELGVIAVPAPGNQKGCLLFYPHKTVSLSNSKPTTDFEALVQCMLNYGGYSHKRTLAPAAPTKASKRNHAIQIESSTGWQPAKNYVADITTWENCIYTLASDPDPVTGVCRVYIGEATNPISRVKTRISCFSINGKTYIDHTAGEAAEHKFTRFRIDRLASESTEYLHDAQDLAIGIAYMLRKECPKGYTMTNKAQAKAFNIAIEQDSRDNGGPR